MSDEQVPGPRDADPQEHEALRPIEVEQAFERALDEGRRRMSRPLVPLISAGFVGGVDLAAGFLAYLLVRYALGPGPGSQVLAGLAFTVGIVAVTMARSELFTENFLIPVVTVVARQATVLDLVRLWGVTLLANLVAGWGVTWLIVLGFPQMSGTAVASGAKYVTIGIGVQSLALAVLAGMVWTLMTWMQHSTTSMGVRIWPAVAMGFLLTAGGLNHSVLSSLSIFTGLHTGQAPYDYLDWLAVASWAALWNLIGGVVFVTALRLLQVPHRVRKRREQPPPSVQEDPIS